MFWVTAIPSTLEGESWVALGLLGFSVKICQPCFLPVSWALIVQFSYILLRIATVTGTAESLKTHRGDEAVKKEVNKVGLDGHGF